MDPSEFTEGVETLPLSFHLFWKGRGDCKCFYGPRDQLSEGDIHHGSPFGGLHVLQLVHGTALLAL